MLDAFGAVVAPQELVADKARAVAIFLQEGGWPYARLIEARQGDKHSTVVMEVDVEVGQRPRHDIRPREPLAVVFLVKDQAWPMVLALREDFPDVLPHLNVQPIGLPPSLCLSDQTYADARLRWTPVGYIRLIQEWLSLTARGELHSGDQPVEPLLLQTFEHVIIPHRLLTEGAGPETLYGYQCWEDRKAGAIRRVYQIVGQLPEEAKELPRLILAPFSVASRQHGVIHRTPTNLAALLDLVAAERFDLFAFLADRLRLWRQDTESRNAYIVLLMTCPLKRTTDGAVERNEYWAFMLEKPVWEVGDSLGLWVANKATGGRQLADLLVRDTSRTGDDIIIRLLNPHLTLSSAQAADLNRIDADLPHRVVVVGVGALGSQLTTNLSRAGLLPSAIIDEDFFFPHNLARHALLDNALGVPKAIGMSDMMEHILDEQSVPEALVADLLVPGDNQEKVATALRNANLILDLSTSIAVARHLANNDVGPARRLSLFLNPRGSDLVLLAEDARRSIPLDQLEMQYYATLVEREGLGNHLARSERIRYARSCRDLSGRIPQAAVALHAGIASEAVRRASELDGAQITIWQTDESQLTVGRVDIAAETMRRVQIGYWQVLITDSAIRTVTSLRASKLPRETGGVLVGDCDMERHRIYLVSALGAPPDSEEWPTHYIRGSRGLQKHVEAVSQWTAGMVRYAGEWHSHPDGASCFPSDEDNRVQGWLEDYMRAEGYPPVMLIVCEHDRICCVVSGSSALIS